MDENRRRDVLRRSVADIVALESRLEEALDRNLQVMQTHPEAGAAGQRFHAMVRSQRDAMKALLKSMGGSDADSSPSEGPSLFRVPFGGEDKVRTGGVSGALRDVYTAFHYLAISYGMLFEMALRLYDPPLREIAPKHLKAYAEAAQSINRLIAAVVAGNSRRRGWNARASVPCVV